MEMFLFLEVILFATRRSRAANVGRGLGKKKSRWTDQYLASRGPATIPPKPKEH